MNVIWHSLSGAGCISTLSTLKLALLKSVTKSRILTAIKLNFCLLMCFRKNSTRSFSCIFKGYNRMILVTLSMQYIAFSLYKYIWDRTRKEEKGKYFHYIFKMRSGLWFIFNPKHTSLQRKFLETTIEIFKIWNV